MNSNFSSNILSGNVLRRFVEKCTGGLGYNTNVALVSILRATRASPYQEVNDRHEQIFVHVPRTGGTSVADALFQESVGGHVPLYTYRAFDSERYDRYFKFAFVRNPYSRLVSSFHQVKYNANNPRTQRWAENHLRGIETFGTFVQQLEDDWAFRRTVTSMDHFRPQWEFLTVDGEVGVDFLGRFECLEADYREVADVLQIERQLPHKNKSSHESYKKYYNEKEKKVVKEIYKKDFHLFEYSEGLL